MSMGAAMRDTDFFLEKADQCFMLSRKAERNSELQTALVQMAYELMAKAVEMDTERDRAAKLRPDST